VGPFEEEEEGTGVTSDVLVVKVKGEDPDTPGGQIPTLYIYDFTQFQGSQQSQLSSQINF